MRNYRLMSGLNNRRKFIPFIRKCRLFGLALIATLLGSILSSAFADTDNSATSGNSENVSTAVLFDRIHPIAVITRDEIRRSGVSNVSDLIFNNGSDFNALGLRRSLVQGSGNVAFLLNGRPTSGSTVNALPLSVVERIELLGDDASAVYGSNAISGAINVVTHRAGIEGFESWAEIERPSEPGADMESTGVIWSPVVEDSKVMAVVEHWRREEIRAADRFFSKAYWETRGAFGDTQGVSLSGNTVSSQNRFRSVGTCDENYYTGVLNRVNQNDPNGTVCGFPYANYSFELEGEERTNFIFDFESDLTDDSSVYTNFMVTDEKSHNRYAPPVGTFELPANLLPSNHEFYAENSNEKVRLHHRFIGHGNRDWVTDGDIFDLTIGFRNQTESGHKYDVSLHRYSHQDLQIGNTFVSEDKIKAILANPTTETTYNFINPLSTEAKHLNAIKQSRLTKTHDIKTSTTVLLATMDGILETNNGKDIRWKAGSEYSQVKRTDDLDHRDINNKSYPLADAIGSGGLSYSGKRDTWSLFGESVFSVLENFELSTAGRYENNSDVDDTLSGQLAARMRLSDNLQLRTSIGEGDKPPSFEDLYLKDLVAYFYVCDVVANPICETGTNSQKRAVTAQYKSIITGNPTLKPEKVRTFNVGLHAEFDPLTVAVNYFSTDRNKVPDYLSAQDIVELEKANKLPPLATVDRNGGEIEQINIPITNSGEIKVEGIDLRSKLIRKTDWGELDVGLNILHTVRYSTKNAGEDTTTDFPKNRMDIYVSGMRGDLTATWRIGAISSYLNPRKSARYETWIGHDLTFGWKNAFNVSGLTVRGGILNVTDESPSLDPTNRSVYASTSPISSRIGRTISISAEMKW